jgi:hypothetical protein
LTGSPVVRSYIILSQHSDLPTQSQKVFPKKEENKMDVDMEHDDGMDGASSPTGQHGSVPPGMTSTANQVGGVSFRRYNPTQPATLDFLNAALQATADHCIDNGLQEPVR